MGSTNTANNGQPDNHYDRYNQPSNHYRVALSIPGGTHATGCYLRLIDFDPYMVNSYRWQGADLLTPSSWWLADGYLKWSDGRAFRGDSGGPAVQAINDNGTLRQTWVGGVGGYVTWAYDTPGAPTLQAGERTNNGTSIRINVNSGSGRVTYNRVSLDNSTWYENNTTFNNLTATASYGLYGFSGNEDSNSAGTYLGTLYGVPEKVGKPVATRSTTTSGRIDVSWSAPTSSLTIDYYHIYRNNVYLNTVYGTTYPDLNLSVGSSYVYTVYAHNSTGWSVVSDGSDPAIAPGTPATPGIPSITTSGRNVTIRTAKTTEGYGNSILGYRVRYRTTTNPNTLPIIWSAWSTAEDMTIDPTDNTKYLKLFEQMPPALSYQFQTYAYNSITKQANGTSNIAPDNYNFATSIIQFVSAGGRRKQPDGSYKPTEYAKRWSSSLYKWVDFTIAKRWSASQNKWVDLS